jgi:hypothetical protein
MKGHIVELRFGVIAVDKGFITAEQLTDALRIQVTEELERHEHRLIGAILLDMGFISNAQIGEVVKELMKKRKSE